jgi:hypothetical protein
MRIFLREKIDFDGAKYHIVTIGVIWVERHQTADYGGHPAPTGPGALHNRLFCAHLIII